MILFTVLVQGTTLGPLIRRLALDAKTRLPDGHLDANMARVAVNEAGLASLETMLEPETGTHRHPVLVEQYRRRVWATSRLRDDRSVAEVERDAHMTAALGAIRAGRSALIGLHREGASTARCSGPSRPNSTSRNCICAGSRANRRVTAEDQRAAQPSGVP